MPHKKNDISRLDRTRTVGSRFESVEDACTYLMEQLVSLYKAVHKISSTTKLVTCLLYGIHLATYNRSTELHPDQDLVNDIIAEVNKFIVSLNIDNNVQSQYNMAVKYWNTTLILHVYFVAS